MATAMDAINSAAQTPGQYWIGTNGNVYTVDNQGKVVDRGLLSQNYQDPNSGQGVGFDAANLSAQNYRQIEDPNPVDFNQVDYNAAQNANGSGNGSSFTDTSAARRATESAIGALDTEWNTGLGNIDTQYDSLIGGYDTEAGRVAQDYEKGTVDNNNALSRNRQNALLAAAQGRRGLRGTLASLGALSGDGGMLADQAVTTAANQDIGGATDAYATNASSLDTAEKRFREEDEARRKAALAEKTTQRTALEGDIAGKRQGYYEKMATLWGQQGNNAEAAKYLGMTEPLNEVVARSRGITPSGFKPGQAAFTPGSLESYLAGAGDMSVKVDNGGGAPGSPQTIRAGYNQNRRRDEETI